MDQYFIDSFLKAGGRYSGDNIIFTSCSPAFLSIVNEIIENDNNPLVLPCKVEIKNDDIMLIAKVQSLFDDKIKKDVLTRTFLTIYVAKNTMQSLGIDDFKNVCSQSDLEVGLRAFHSLNAQKIKDFYLMAPLPEEIDRMIAKLDKKIELNLVLPNGNNNALLQRYINNYIGSRLPYCVKLFTAENSLCSYFTSNGQFIERPHDYQSVDVKNLEIDSERE